MMKRRIGLLVIIFTCVVSSGKSEWGVEAFKRKQKIQLEPQERRFSIGITGGPQYARTFNIQDSIFYGRMYSYVGNNGLLPRYERVYVGGTVGIKAQIFFTNYLFVKGELAYSNQGAIYKYDKASIFGKSDQLAGLLSKKLHYIKLPVQFGFNANFNRCTVKISAGVHASFLLAYHEVYEVYASSYSYAGDSIIGRWQYAGYIDAKNSSEIYGAAQSNQFEQLANPRTLQAEGATYKPWVYKKVTWGIDYSLGITMRLTERWDLDFEFRGDYEFIDCENKKSIITFRSSGLSADYSAFSFKNRTKTNNLTSGISVGVSYLFLKK